MTAFIFTVFLAISQTNVNPYLLEFREQTGYENLAAKETVLIVTYLPVNVDIAVILRPRGPYTSWYFGPRIVTVAKSIPHVDVMENIIYQYKIWRKKHGLDVPEIGWQGKN